MGSTAASVVSESEAGGEKSLLSGRRTINRIRSQNFGDPHQHLTHSKATVVLFFSGLTSRSL